jgi:hypothetical protein
MDISIKHKWSIGDELLCSMMMFNEVH